MPLGSETNNREAIKIILGVYCGVMRELHILGYYGLCINGSYDRILSSLIR